jgi:hypothetical protein
MTDKAKGNQGPKTTRFVQAAMVDLFQIEGLLTETQAKRARDMLHEEIFKRKFDDCYAKHKTAAGVPEAPVDAKKEAPPAPKAKDSKGGKKAGKAINPEDLKQVAAAIMALVQKVED